MILVACILAVIALLYLRYLWRKASQELREFRIGGIE